MKSGIFTAFCLLFLPLYGSAQLHYGFKTGLNFANIKADSETDGAGVNLETFNRATGFHIAMSLSYELTDNFGLRGEFGYSKKGYKYIYDGDSHFTFRSETGDAVARGKSRFQINISNSYLEIPLMAYAKLGKLEVSGGVYGGFLVQSTGEGDFRFSEGRPLANPNFSMAPAEFNLFYNYRKDDPGEAEGDIVIVDVGQSKKFEIPQTLGAYYESSEDRGNLFNGFDYGLTAGASFYLNSALYLGARLQYGLGDWTNNKADASRFSLNQDNTPVLRNDKDVNFTIQASVGFSF